MGFLEFVRDHFLHVLPLFIAGGVAISIIMERVKTLFYTYPIKDQEGFFQRITEYVMQGKTTEAVALCESMPEKPTAKVVKSALMRSHQPEGLIEHALELSVGEASKNIQKRTGFLSTIANVAVLLGLFGTIAGLISSFAAVAHADPQQKSAMLSAGIATAMNATMTGLAVAIPTMIAFSFLINRSNQLISDLETSAVRTLDILKQSFYQIDELDYSNVTEISQAKSKSKGQKNAEVENAA